MQSGVTHKQIFNEISQKVVQEPREAAEVSMPDWRGPSAGLSSVGLAFSRGLDKVTSKGPFSLKLHPNNQEGQKSGVTAVSARDHRAQVKFPCEKRCLWIEQGKNEKCSAVTLLQGAGTKRKQLNVARG